MPSNRELSIWDNIGKILSTMTKRVMVVEAKSLINFKDNKPL